MIDLHCHSVYSDGKLTLEELLKVANENKLEVFSITDHNNIDVHIEASKTNIKDYFGGEFIFGCEFNCMLEGIRIELLGYNFNLNEIKKWLDYNYSGQNNSEKLINQFKMLYEKCKNNNLVINDNIMYDPLKDYPMDFIHSELIKYPENIKFIGKDAFNSSSTFYRKCTANKNYFLYCDFSAYVPTIEEVSNLIRKCQGLVFFAHPYGYKLEDYDYFFNKLTNSGLIDGFECYHSAFSEEQTAKLITYCKNNNLLISGGSDFHCFEDRNLIGTGFNNKLKISKDILNNWPKKSSN